MLLLLWKCIKIYEVEQEFLSDKAITGLGMVFI